MERLIPKEGYIEVPNCKYLSSDKKSYVLDYSIMNTFHYFYIYEYLGWKFYVGTFTEEKYYDALLESTTFALAVHMERNGLVPPLINTFKRKLEKSKLTLAEVIRNASVKNAELPLWKLSLLSNP